MKFDVVIGNPPYQEADKGESTGSTPVYDKFFMSALKLKPKFINMIIPSRWMMGGRGLNGFRKQMINDTRINRIVDYQDASDVFENVKIDSGVCYLIWDDQHSGPLRYTYNDNDGYTDTTTRYLKTDLINTVIRDTRHYDIIERVHNFSIKNNEKMFNTIVSPRNPFGYNTDLFNKPEKYKNITISDTKKDGFIEVHGVHGVRGSLGRISKYINFSSATKNIDSIDKYKLLFSKSYSTYATIPPEPIIAGQGVACTDTFLKIGDFNTIGEVTNLARYMKSKFFRALLLFNRISLSVSRGTFSLIPLQDFTSASDIDWTQSIADIDQQLYKKYGLNEEEIEFIETNIKEME